MKRILFISYLIQQLLNFILNVFNLTTSHPHCEIIVLENVKANKIMKFLVLNFLLGKLFKILF
jgi:hypothetical protein